MICSLNIVLMKQRSSTTFAVWGISSLTHCPDCPCCVKLNCEGTIGSVAWFAVKPVSRWPPRTESGRFVPARSFSIGL